MSTTPDDDAQTTADLAHELETYAALPLDMRAITAFQMAGVVQLAMRHPDLPPNVRRTASAFLEIIRAHFHAAPTVLDVLRRGDNPRHDRPRDASTPDLPDPLPGQRVRGDF